MKTGNKPLPPQSALSRFMPDAPDTEEMKREGWVKHGILVLSMEDPELSMMDREFMKLVGNRRYGRRDG